MIKFGSALVLLAVPLVLVDEAMSQTVTPISTIPPRATQTHGSRPFVPVMMMSP